MSKTSEEEQCGSGNGKAEVGTKEPKTISLDSEVLEQGQARAREENRSFSNYLETLMRADIARAKAAAVQDALAVVGEAAVRG